MLTQLTRLSVEADGRYATSEEVQGLKTHFQSLPQRVSAYEKIRDAEAEIFSQVEAKMRSQDPKLYLNTAGEFDEKCKRDSLNLLRYTAAALLFNEQEYLREGLLVWYNTIAKSYQCNKICNMSLTVMSEVVKQYLTPEEAALFCPLLDLNKIVLG